jgi:hypothetical protein
MNTIIIAALAALALLAAGAPARGQSREVAIEAGHRRFAEQYVVAASARDPLRYRTLIHPKSLDCITDDNRDFFDDWMGRAFRWSRRKCASEKFPPNPCRTIIVFSDGIMKRR